MMCRWIVSLSWLLNPIEADIGPYIWWWSPYGGKREKKPDQKGMTVLPFFIKRKQLKTIFRGG